jgi:hypothetical protein
MNLRSLLFWKKKPTVESVSMAVKVRNALRVVMSDTDISDEQFEELYCLVIDREVNHPHSYDSGGLIGEFIREHAIKIK